jgi:hypothetical protein
MKIQARLIVDVTYDCDQEFDAIQILDNVGASLRANGSNQLNPDGKAKIDSMYYESSAWLKKIIIPKED